MTATGARRAPITMRAVVGVELPDQVVADLSAKLVGFDVVYEPDLVAAYDSDATRLRSARASVAWHDLIDSADVMLGIPDHSPAALAALIRRSTRLRWVHTIAAGGGSQIGAAGLTDAELERVAFTTSAGVHAQPLAEFALMGVLLGLKRMPQLAAAQRERRWESRRTLGLLAESTVTVVGLGHVGRRTAAVLHAVGARVLGVHRRELGLAEISHTFAPERLGEALGVSDAVVLALPHTAATRHLLGAAALASAKPGITVVNVGRGSTIDERALVDALIEGRVATAVLDVTEVEPLPDGSPLWSLPGVYLSPHTAALAEGEPARVADLFAENAERWRRGEALRNRVDITEFY